MDNNTNLSITRRSTFVIVLTASVLAVLIGLLITLLTNVMDGKSAYDLAVSAGYTGTEEEWLLSLKGEKGDTGAKGDIGEKGETGAKGDAGVGGANGEDGLSAYEIAQRLGYTGTMQEWLQSLVGATGQSAYDMAVERGYTGTPEDWLNTLRGVKGEKGDRGAQGEQGESGLSAYELAKAAGYADRFADEQAFIDYLVNRQGEKGDKGDQGEQGEKGDKGDQGAQGEKGEKGDQGEQGIQGIQGIQGVKGDRGEQGFTGATGATGAAGKSAYELAKEAGYASQFANEQEFIDYLVARQGEKGDKGDTGATGLGVQNVTAVDGFKDSKYGFTFTFTLSDSSTIECFVEVSTKVVSNISLNTNRYDCTVGGNVPASAIFNVMYNDNTVSSMAIGTIVITLKDYSGAVIDWSVPCVADDEAYYHVASWSFAGREYSQKVYLAGSH